MIRIQPKEYISERFIQDYFEGDLVIRNTYSSMQEVLSNRYSIDDFL